MEENFQNVEEQPLKAEPIEAVPETQNNLPPHKNFMIWSIIESVLCCPIYYTGGPVWGLASLVFSILSNSKYKAAAAAASEEDRNSLFKTSEKFNKLSKIFFWVGLGLGIIGLIIIICVIVALGGISELIDEMY